MTVASSSDWPRVREAGFTAVMAPVPGKTGPVSRRSDDAIVVFRRYATAKRAAVIAALDFLTGRVQYDGMAAGSMPPRQGIPAGSVPPGLPEAFACGRNTPLAGSWGAIEFEMMRYLTRAFRWRAAVGSTAP
jgi:hypothetical protein